MFPQALYHWDMGLGINCVEKELVPWVRSTEWGGGKTIPSVEKWHLRPRLLSVATPLTTADWFCWLVGWFLVFIRGHDQSPLEGN